MASPDGITKTVKRYLELAANGSADEIAALYADDATVEDPVGSELRRGGDAIREFYALVENLERHVELEAIRSRAMKLPTSSPSPSNSGTT